MTGYVGTRVLRREDDALLAGRGKFVADIMPQGLLHVAVVRSTTAHGVITDIDTSTAERMPGVHAVYTAANLPRNAAATPCPLHVPNPAITKPYTWRALASSEVVFVGEPVAIVVADDRYLAEDAAEAVIVQYDDLPMTTSIEDALPANVVTHRGDDDNIAAKFTVGYGDVDRAFDSADLVVGGQYRPHRGAGSPIECRGVVAIPESDGRTLTVWTSSQAPHLVKRSLIDVLGLSAADVRVIAPADVGGAFGSKIMTYPEEIAVAAIALELKRPVRWIEDRREHFLSTTQERDQIWDVELAVAKSGKLLGIRGTLLHDLGAYAMWGIITPYISATTLPGPYVLPSYSLETTVLLTNAVPTTPIRGAGRPQAIFVLERLLDRAARELSIDRATIREINLVTPEQMPYEVGLTFRDGGPVTYDGGDYPRALRECLLSADYEGFAQRRQDSEAAGKFRGIGIGCYVEGTGLGPFEGARVTVEQNGRVTVYVGAGPQGQGHHTTMAQIVADALTVPIDSVDVISGDTAVIAKGIGTFGSRVVVNEGSSAHRAASAVRAKILRLAATMLEIDSSDLTLSDGVISVRGDDQTRLTVKQVAAAAQGVPGFVIGEGDDNVLEETDYFTPPQAAYSYGVHIAEVEVDRKTAGVRVVRYSTVHDCGRVINPLIVAGQIQGGVAHGIGNALFERVDHDYNGQPTSTSFADYLLPTASVVPKVTMSEFSIPTEGNPLGAKGVGEAGTLPGPACVVGAIEDALYAAGARIEHHPVFPHDLVGFIETATSTTRP